MMLNIHSWWAYLVLIFLILATINAITGLRAKRDFEDKDLRISLFTLIVTHIQVLIGLGWYFMSPAYKILKESGMKGMDAYTRLLAVEHPIIMLLAVVLITIGWSKHKKKESDAAKFKTIAIFYGIALILVLSRIPWNTWFN